MKNKIPFEFILDNLHPIDLTIKPMFGCHAIYGNGKILLIVRKKNDHIESNGVWIATGKEHHESLKKELPGLQSVHILSNGKNETGWQMIHQDADDFEEAVIKVCEMVLKEDARIGKVPKKKKSLNPKGRKIKKPLSYL